LFARISAPGYRSIADKEFEMSAGRVRADLDWLLVPSSYAKVFRRSQEVISLVLSASRSAKEKAANAAALLYITTDFCRLVEQGKPIDRCRGYYSSTKYPFPLADGSPFIGDWRARTILSSLQESLGKDLAVDKTASYDGAAGSIYTPTANGIAVLRLVAKRLVDEALAYGIDPSLAEPKVIRTEYFALPAEDIGRRSKLGIFIRCPIHSDGKERTPSAIMFEGGSRAVYCFACARTIGGWKEEDGTYYLSLLLNPTVSTARRAPDAIPNEVEFVDSSQPPAPLESCEVMAAFDSYAACESQIPEYRTRLEAAKTLATVGRGKHVSRMVAREFGEGKKEIRVPGKRPAQRRLGAVRTTLYKMAGKSEPKLRYATRVDPMEQMSTSWSKVAKFGDNENSDEYMTLASALEALAPGVDPKATYPDEYITIHDMTHDDETQSDRKYTSKEDGSTEIIVLYKPKSFRAVSGQYVLIDIDHLDRRTHSPMTAEGREIEAKMVEGFRSALSSHAASPMFSGRGTVVETSKTGMQILLQLSRPLITQHALESFYADPLIKQAIMSLGEEMRKVMERGGEVDPAVHTVGRNARLAGTTRIDKNGGFFISRLIATL
jgi:hypothetical protein